MKVPDRSQLQSAWEEVQRLHQIHLAEHQVKIPNAESFDEATKAIWLATLWHYKGQEVDKNHISEVVLTFKPDAAPDQQVRHLKRDGWEIGTVKGKHKLDPTRVSEPFLRRSTRHNMRLKATSFSEIKNIFGGRCATCGAYEGEPDPRYGGENVKLQQGHKDPCAAGDDYHNIIPQCQFCNRAYRDDYEFDDRGRVHAVVNIGPVKRASQKVQQLVFEWLQKQVWK